MKFNIDDYKGNYVMHCKTEEEDKSFREYLHSVGRKWASGHSYLTLTYWDNEKDSACYVFNDNFKGKVSIYKSQGFTILEWSDFMEKKFTKADLKNGDVIQKRNGNVEIVCVDTGTLITTDHHNRLDDIREDLTSMNGCDYDIVAVRRPTDCGDCSFIAFQQELGELVYDRERKEVEEMTLEEVCKALGKEIKIVKEH